MDVTIDLVPDAVTIELTDTAFSSTDTATLDVSFLAESAVPTLEQQTELVLTETISQIIELNKGYSGVDTDLPSSKTMLYDANNRIIRIDSANGDYKAFSYLPNGDIHQIEMLAKSVHSLKTLVYANGLVVGVVAQVL